MAWGPYCQPMSPYWSGPLLSLLLQPVLHTPLILCHTPSTSVLNSRWKAQQSPLLFIPQCVHGTLGASSGPRSPSSSPNTLVAVLVLGSVQSSSGTPHFLMQFCPWTAGSSCPAPGPLAPLVLTTYCPPSRHNCNSPFSICLSVRHSHLGVLGLPTSSCCQPLPPSSSQTAAAVHESGPPESRQDPGKQVSPWFLLAGYSHNCCHGNVEMGQCFPFQQAACSLLAEASWPQDEGQGLPPEFEASAVWGPK